MIPCDASHPYFDGTNCIDCAINRNTSDIANHKPYFNLKTKQCQNCIKYNSNTHKCEDNDTDTTNVTPVNPNVKPPVTTTTCPAGQVFMNSTSSCHQLVSNVTAISQSDYI